MAENNQAATASKVAKKVFFVLGGQDLEMQIISRLLQMAGVPFWDSKKQWGDLAFSPEDAGLTRRKETNGPLDRGGRMAEMLYLGEEKFPHDTTFYFVECRPKDWPTGYRVEVIDHHGEYAGMPASVLQILSILESKVGFRISDETRRWVEIVAANDDGYIGGMRSIGVDEETVAKVRRMERAITGVTPTMEREAERAIAEADAYAKAERGELVVIRMSHSKVSTVSDRLFDSWKDGWEHLLVLSGDGEVNYFGDGALCAALLEKFPEAPVPWNPSEKVKSWAGKPGLGKVGEHAFFGGYPDHEEVLDFIKTGLIFVEKGIDPTVPEINSAKGRFKRFGWDCRETAKALINLADKAKNGGVYEIANVIFAHLLLHVNLYDMELKMEVHKEGWAFDYNALFFFEVDGSYLNIPVPLLKGWDEEEQDWEGDSVYGIPREDIEEVAKHFHNREVHEASEKEKDNLQEELETLLSADEIEGAQEILNGEDEE